jgi:hypothetical protein
MVDGDLLQRAKDEDARHWDTHRRPIFADTLRKKLPHRCCSLQASQRTHCPGTVREHPVGAASRLRGRHVGHA